MAEQHMQGVKKSPSQSIRRQLLVREEKRGNFTPAVALPSLACHVQRGGKPAGCHIHLDFYECFDSSPEDTPVARWRVFTQAVCRAGKKKKKKLGGGMFAYPIRFNREKTKYILITTAGNVSGSGPREAGRLNAPCPDHQV